MIGVVGVDYTVSDYLQSRNIKHSSKSGWVRAKCPACGGKSPVQKRAKRTLYVRTDTGTWNCGSCKRTGSFVGLRRLLGDKTPVATSADVARQFEVLMPEFTRVEFREDYEGSLCFSENLLESYDLPESSLKQFRVGYSKDFEALTFPYMYTRKDTVSYLRFWRPEDDWWRVAGDAKTCSWFGQHLFKGGIDTATITQTPIDAVALHGYGEKNVLSPHVNIPDIRYRSQHLALLQGCSVIWIVPAPTDEGAQWALATQEQLGRWRCKIVQLDAWPRSLSSNTGLGSGLGSEVWAQAKARSSSALGVRVARATTHIHALDTEYDGGPEIRGFHTRLEPLDALLGGWRKGELTIMGGGSGVGKSTLAAFLSLLQASDQKPVLYASFEVLAKTMLKKWLIMLGGSGLESMTRSEYVNARKKIASRPLYLADTYGMASIDDVRKCVYDTVTRYKAEFVVVDHLGHLSSNSSTERKVSADGEIVRELKRWALDLRIHLLVLAHLRKPGVDKRPATTMEDLRGSSEIYQTADNVILLDRRREGTDLTVRLVKVRSDSGFEGKLSLAFDPGSLRYEPK
jgi:KaiC/GvpD/RAD55 family RecA-like ATPase